MVNSKRRRYEPSPEERLLTASEAAEILACSAQHVRNLWDRGEMPYVRVGADRRMKYVDLMAWIDRNTNAPHGIESIPLSPHPRPRRRTANR